MQRSTLVEQLVEHFTKRITSNDWEVGEKIPSVQKLSNEYEVSSVTVREALRVLQIQSLISVKQGVGTFVLPPKPHQLVGAWKISPKEVGDYIQVLEARKYLERSIVELAVQKADDEDVSQILRASERLALASTKTMEFIDADMDFHAALARASRNAILEAAMSSIRGPLKRIFLNRLSLDLNLEGSLDVAVNSHRRLAVSISKRNLADALAAIDDISSPSEKHLCMAVSNFVNDDTTDTVFSR